MADHTINIDVHDISVPELNPINIAIINLPNPVIGYSANAKEVKDLIQIPKYTIYESGTSNVINGRNYYDYFPEEGGGGGGMTPEEVATIVSNMTDSEVSDVSTNPIQNSAIKEYVDSTKVTVDSAIDENSTNAIQNGVIAKYVNSSIETATATFRGTYNTKEALDVVSGDKNDYAFLVTTDAAGNTLYNRYKYVTIDTGSLPEGYSQLLYISNDGDSYFDTGINPKSDLGFYIKFKSDEYVDYTTYMGLDGFSNRRYNDPWMLRDKSDSMTFQNSASGVALTGFDYSIINEITCKNMKISVNNGDIINIPDPGAYYYTGNNTIFVFGYRSTSGSHVGSPTQRIDLYALTFFDSDGETILANFIPCRSPQNEIGVYDTISEKFISSSGGSSFKPGPAADGYWEFEYSLNNSSYTAEQWAAINSGLKASDKTQIATNANDISSLNANKLDKTGTAAKATADSDGNNIITTYAKKTDLNDIACTYRGTYTTTEALNAASGDINDFAFLKTTDSAGNEIYSRYRRVEIPQVVPEGYTQLMYISSNGTQYIDTGVQAKRDLKSYIKFARINSSTGGYFGARDDSYKYQLRYDNWSGKLYCEIGAANVNISKAMSSIDEIMLEYPTITVNGTVFNISTQSDFTLEENIYLCAANGNSNKGNISLYECIIYDDDKTTELKHFYPCKNSSNVCGMYDIVEGVFYPDANGGNFTAGPQANGYWSFEYSIPGNLFSSAQFSAINSGINTTKVAQIATNANDISSLQEQVGYAISELEGVL